MKELVNTGRRRLGIAGRPGFILEPNRPKLIDDEQEKFLQTNRTLKRWLETGVLVIRDNEARVEATQPEAVKVASPKVQPKQLTRRADVRETEPLPEGVTGDGVEMHHLGGGWWQVYVNGFRVTDRNVRKEEAVEMASEYGDGTDG